ncbi:DUF2892 domain-containing protein [Methylobacillus caricis]|uniref:YgaP family membrane protein n=1 Tax=Methylobacillus caricis TaxID=1971611 RepID=UPI001CFF5C1C|nr:DUF2892 domain-containing protein [Methylobacillus caricis]MCB5187105.1 DUF2892 domain-containing protein [Methylobacillus caricis]
MKANVGGLDRVLRAGWAVFFQRPVWAYIRALPPLTGLLCRCSAYTLLGVRTCNSRVK